MLTPLEAPTSRWTVISLDFKTGLPLVRGVDSVLVVTDRFTRRVRLIPTSSSVTAEDCAYLLLDHIVKLHGLPDSIISDRDPKFTATVWASLWSALGTRLRMSTANHPQSDGSSERAIRSFLTVLSAILQDHGQDWLFYLPHVEIAINSALNQSIAMSPYEAGLGHCVRTPLDIFLPHDQPGLCATFVQRQTEIAATLSDAAIVARTNQVVRVDRNRRPVQLAVGDLVLVHRDGLTDPFSTSTPPVFRKNFHGPFFVLAVVTPGASYRILLDSSSRAHDVINVQYLRRFRPDMWPERANSPPPPTAEGEHFVSGILRHRPPARRSNPHSPDVFRFETVWLGHAGSTWEPASAFYSPESGSWNAHFLRYISTRRRRGFPSADEFVASFSV